MLYLCQLIAALLRSGEIDRGANKYFHPTSLKTSIEMPLTYKGNKA